LGHCLLLDKEPLSVDGWVIAPDVEVGCVVGWVDALARTDRPACAFVQFASRHLLLGLKQLQHLLLRVVVVIGARELVLMADILLLGTESALLES